MISRQKTVHPRQRARGSTSPKHIQGKAFTTARAIFQWGMSEFAIEIQIERGNSRSTSAESRPQKENHRNSRVWMAVLSFLRGRLLTQEDKVCNEGVLGRKRSDKKTIQEPDKNFITPIISLLLSVWGSSKKESKIVVIAWRLPEEVSGFAGQARITRAPAVPRISAVSFPAAEQTALCSLETAVTPCQSPWPASRQSRPATPPHEFPPLP